MNSSEILMWLKQSPLEEEIGQHEDGGKFIPYPIIVSKLDTLSPHSWETKNFHHFFFHCKDGKIKVSGSIDVVVEYNGRQRTLSGAASFYTEEYAPNEHWAATVKSLAICNAVLILGEQFGKNINPQEDQPQDSFSGPITTKKQNTARTMENRVKLKPDKEIRMRFAKASAEQNTDEVNNLLSTYNFE